MRDENSTILQFYCAHTRVGLYFSHRKQFKDFPPIITVYKKDHSVMYENYQYFMIPCWTMLKRNCMTQTRKT